MVIPLGTHTLTATPFSGTNGTGIKGTPFSVSFTIPVLVESATLVNAQSDQDLQQLSDGTILSMKELPTVLLNIRANTSPVKVDSVQFYLDGTKVRTEQFIPYAFAGDRAGTDYLPRKFSTGEYNLTIVPYGSYLGAGFQGTTKNIFFKIVDEEVPLCNGKPYDPTYQECTACGIVDRDGFVTCTPCGLISRDLRCCEASKQEYESNVQACTPCGIIDVYGGEDCTPCGIIDTNFLKCTPCGVLLKTEECEQSTTRAPGSGQNLTEEIKKITLSPNPVRDNLRIFMDRSDKKYEVTILSSSGALIRTLNVQNVNQLSIDMSQLPAGIYFMKFRGQEKSVYKRFVKL